jgi:hypothetical protein
LLKKTIWRIYFIFLFSSHSIRRKFLKPKKNVGRRFFGIFVIMIWHHYFLVVLLVRVNTEVVAATWTNALGGRVAVSARPASITKMSAATNAFARSATWANIATWK